MLKTRHKVASQLSEIRAVRFHKPTVRELRYRENHLIRRVQRREDASFKRRVEERKKKLEFDLKKIDKYLLDVESEKFN